MALASAPRHRTLTLAARREAQRRLALRLASLPSDAPAPLPPAPPVLLLVDCRALLDQTTPLPLQQPPPRRAARAPARRAAPAPSARALEPADSSEVVRAALRRLAIVVRHVQPSAILLLTQPPGPTWRRVLSYLSPEVAAAAAAGAGWPAGGLIQSGELNLPRAVAALMRRLQLLGGEGAAGGGDVSGGSAAAAPYGSGVAAPYGNGGGASYGNGAAAAEAVQLRAGRAALVGALSEQLGSEEAATRLLPPEAAHQKNAAAVTAALYDGDTLPYDGDGCTAATVAALAAAVQQGPPPGGGGGVAVLSRPWLSSGCLVGPAVHAAVRHGTAVVRVLSMDERVVGLVRQDYMVGGGGGGGGAGPAAAAADVAVLRWASSGGLAEINHPWLAPAELSVPPEVLRAATLAALPYYAGLAGHPASGAPGVPGFKAARAADVLVRLVRAGVHLGSAEATAAAAAAASGWMGSEERFARATFGAVMAHCPGSVFGPVGPDDAVRLLLPPPRPGAGGAGPHGDGGTEAAVEEEAAEAEAWRQLMAAAAVRDVEALAAALEGGGGAPGTAGAGARTGAGAEAPAPVAATAQPSPPPPPPSWLLLLDDPVDLPLLPPAAAEHDDTASTAAAAATASADGSTAAAPAAAAAAAGGGEVVRVVSYTTVNDLATLRSLVSHLTATLNGAAPVVMAWEPPTKARPAASKRKRGGSAAAAAAPPPKPPSQERPDDPRGGRGLVGLSLAWPATAEAAAAAEYGGGGAVQGGGRNAVVVHAMHVAHVSLQPTEGLAAGGGDGGGGGDMGGTASTAAGVDAGAEEGDVLTPRAAAAALAPLLRPDGGGWGADGEPRWCVVMHDLKRFALQCASAGLRLPCPPPPRAHFDTLAAAYVLHSELFKVDRPGQALDTVVLANMQLAGFGIDVPSMTALHNQAQQRLEEVRLRVEQLAGWPVDMSRPEQLRQLLFDQLGLAAAAEAEGEEFRAGVSGESSTAKDLPQPQRAQRRDKDEVGPLMRDFRRSLVARPGWVLLAADYGQVELRVLAHITQDPGLSAAFAQRRDVHRETASRLFGLPADQVSEQQRQQGKQVGSTSDIVKAAMVRTTAALAARGSAAVLLLMIHDELVFELPEAELEDVAPLVREVMVRTAALSVPLEVSIEVGRDMLHMEEVAS
ncbi:DNA polymerase I [Tetrabaena socialis]|uniref:DNA polymerase I n=1 Tax=Tetrabaena socialis TaxID=47790 RepID=A0A2J8A3V0_9CHLO|nr:DNA polymerase I [Tetrabaena socialis]|eukprot:PNH07196.1 DNA polymerase I [Tetrabaena socialis]